jgi:hypothetical protein
VIIVSTTGAVGGFVDLTFLRATFLAPARLGKRFFGIAFATVCFGDFRRVG